jgi:hypothetical protein
MNALTATKIIPITRNELIPNSSEAAKYAKSVDNPMIKRPKVLIKHSRSLDFFV